MELLHNIITGKNTHLNTTAKKPPASAPSLESYKFFSYFATFATSSWQSII
jgi:hypothetical protein